MRDHTYILMEIGSELGFIGKLADKGVKFDVSFSQESSRGDISSNIALRYFKLMGYESPMEAAEKIAEEYNAMKDPCIDRVEAVKPGFVNFYLSKSFLESNLASILEEKDNFGHSNVLKNIRMMVEFTDPNPLKEFHIGHLYSNTVGESLSRLFESQGSEVWRVNYQGDVGLHVAKALYGINLKLKTENKKLEEIESLDLKQKAKFLGEAYALGAKAYEENEEGKKEIENLNKKVYAKDPEIYPLYEKAKKWSLSYFETIYLRLGTKFKRYYFESEAGGKGVEIVRQNLGKVFKEDDGAVIFPQDLSGLHTRVFINSLGLPTYEAKELGLAPTKYKDFPYDRSIIITGNEINEYFKVLLKALSLISPDLAEKTTHLGHGMVRLPSGKMSSRTGDVITGERLLDEVKKKLTSAYPEMDEKVAEDLTVGAVKYAFLKSHVGGDIIFNLEESINLHGNSGPYIQYSYARTRSVLDKVKSQNGSTASRAKFKSASKNLKLEKEEIELLRKLVIFPEIVSTAAEKFAPNNIALYLFELSQLFNMFYEKHRILNIDDEETRNFRLELTAGVGQVLKNGLYLLGIKAPVKI